MSAAAPVTLWLLKYDYVPDILDKRVPHRYGLMHDGRMRSDCDVYIVRPNQPNQPTSIRAGHIGGLQKAAQEGTLVLGA